MSPQTWEPELWKALRHGRRREVVDLMLAATPDERSAVRAGVRRHHDLVMAARGWQRAPGGEWAGPLRLGHWSAAAAGHFACLPVERAVRYPLNVSPVPDARELPPTFFPTQLDAFAREWSARFVRNPKAWDRIIGLDAMFDWAHDELIAPPVHDGAVLYLVAGPPSRRGGGYILRYLEARPCLIGTTMAAIFDVDGVNGASLAQSDETMPTQTRRIDRWVVPQLIRRGHWERRFVLDGIERSLDRGQTPYLQRWFRGLTAVVNGLRP